MKASIPRFMCGLVVSTLAFAASVHGQHFVVQKDGQTRQGEVLGVRGGSIRIKIGPAETSIPLTSVQSVKMDPPADFTKLVETYRQGDAAAALPKLLDLLNQFKDLPADWVERAHALLPEVYLSMGKTAEAEVASRDFEKKYPASSNSLPLLQAKLAIAKKDFSLAREKLSPLVSLARQTMRPKGDDAVACSQALFLMGRIQEQSGEKSEALQNYLLVSTIFNQDSSATTQSRERASVLEKENIMVP